MSKDRLEKIAQDILDKHPPGPNYEGVEGDICVTEQGLYVCKDGKWVRFQVLGTTSNSGIKSTALSDGDTFTITHTVTMNQE